MTLSATYSITLTAKLLGFVGLNTTSATFNVVVTPNYDYCFYYLVWTSLPTISEQTYKATNPLMSIQFSDF